jgi:hypothetical protein
MKTSENQATTKNQETTKIQEVTKIQEATKKDGGAAAMSQSEIQAKIKKESMAMCLALLVLGVLFVVLTALTAVSSVHSLITTGNDLFYPETAAYLYNVTFIAVLTLFAAKLFWNLKKSRTPFTIEITLGIRNIAVVMWAMMVIQMVLDILIRTLKLDTENPGTNFLITLLCVIISVIFYMLSRVFEYGRLLQQESDETL